MATALDLVAKLHVTTVLIAPNQARILEAVHAIKYDDGAALDVGEEVSFTDTDIGYVFFGKIIERRKTFDDGEGYVYICSDAYRTLTKSPAHRALNSEISAKIKINEGAALSQGINAVLSDYTALFPGGVTNNIPDVDLPKMDKGGQNVDTWLDDLLDFTDGGIAYIDPNGGSPELLFEDFYSAPNVTLTIGTYTVISPTPTQLLLQGGSTGESLNKKYQKYTVEGAGIFTRHIEEHTPGEIEEIIPGFPIFQVKFFVSAKKVLARRIDAAGECLDKMEMRIRFGTSEGSGRMEVLVVDPKIARDSASGKLFFWLILEMGGGSLSGAFTPPQINAWLTYTSYDGPFSITETDPAPELAGEGELWEMHCKFFKFLSPDGDVDRTADAQDLVGRLHNRYSGVDQQGTKIVHIAGLNTNLQIGSQLLPFTDMRVRAIKYNFVDRSIACEVSSLPLRPQIQAARQLVKGVSVERNLWYANKKLDGCFCGLETLLDEDNEPVDPDPLEELVGAPSPGGPGAGGPGPGGGAPGGGGAQSTWDCQMGNCVEIQGPGGAFQTVDDCQRVCGAQKRVSFVPCFGCMGVEDPNADYEDQAACQAAHPDPMDGCKWNCTGPHQNPPFWRCQASPEGIYTTQGQCEAACLQPEGVGSGYGSGSGFSGPGGVDGSGEPSSGALSGPAFSGSGNVGVSGKTLCCPSGQCMRCVEIDQFGNVKDIVCTDCGGGAGSGGCEGGITGDVVVLCDIVCEGSTLTRKFTTMTYDAGCLTSCSSECDGGCP